MDLVASSIEALEGRGCVCGDHGGPAAPLPPSPLASCCLEGVRLVVQAGALLHFFGSQMPIAWAEVCGAFLAAQAGLHAS